jgi:PIN domain nuclease of toxin-antitoxin system
MIVDSSALCAIFFNEAGKAAIQAASFETYWFKGARPCEFSVDI